MTEQVQITITADKFGEMIGVGDLSGGERVEFQYDSHFGGTQTVAGDLKIESRTLGADVISVDRRRLKGNVVESLADGREVGSVSEITVTMDYDDALEAITRHWNYDVDDGGDEVYVQMWDGHGDEFGTREVTMHRVEGAV